MHNPMLGRGWKFPIQVDQVTGRIQLVEDDEDVRESIYLIIRSQKGERLMNPTFGSDVGKFVFSGTDPATRSMLAESIKRAIQDWEARVDEVEVEADTHPDDPNRLEITIRYRVVATDARNNLVFPFYV